MTKSIVDLSGQKFGRLTVIAHSGTNKYGKNLWLCICSCGGENAIKKIEQGKLLRKTQNPTRSCGCLVKKHGHTVSGIVSLTYKSWDAMLQRCLNPSSQSYKYYGARGITVCDRWNPSAGGSFENFISDMGERQKGMSIDRIDTSKGYDPSNCRWATMKQQASNRSNTIMLTLGERTQSITEWAEETGIPYATLSHRIRVYGWTHERALTTPNKNKSHRKASDILIEFDGKELCLSEWGRIYNISPATIKNRINLGWSAEQAITTPPMR